MFVCINTKQTAKRSLTCSLRHTVSQHNLTRKKIIFLNSSIEMIKNNKRPTLTKKRQNTKNKIQKKKIKKKKKIPKKLNIT